MTPISRSCLLLRLLWHSGWGVCWSFFAVVGFHEPGRYRFFALLIPLYTRLKKDHLEELENRREILGFIKGQPGTNYSTISRSLEMGNGTLTYHLKVLEENKLIKSRVEGNRKHFYPHRFVIEKKIDRIIEVLRQNPGLNQKDIVRILGVSRRKAARKLNELVLEGVLRIEKRGRENIYMLIASDGKGQMISHRTLTDRQGNGPNN